MKTLIVNAIILTPLSDKPVSIKPSILELKDSCALVENSKIKKIGKYKEIKPLAQNSEIIDLNGYYLVPGFIDCHTHLVFGGKRIDDFIKRQQGLTYQEISEQGGGIKYTVEKTLLCSNLKELLTERIEKMYNNGTTVIEIKNGYAIDINKEIEHLSLIKEVSSFVKALIIPTFLSHIPPEDFQEYKFNLNENASFIRKLTDFFDIFCDKTAFSVKQTLEIIKILKNYRFNFRFHVNEFQDDGLVEELYKMFPDIKVKSFDHLLVLSDVTADVIKKFGAFGVIMPSTSWFLSKNYSPVEKLLKREIPVCLATDYNAGSSNALSLMFVSNLAAIYLKLPPENILSYITLNPAFLLNLEAGQIRENFLASFNVLKTDNWREFCFSLDNSLIEPLIL